MKHLLRTTILLISFSLSPLSLLSEDGQSRLGAGQVRPVTGVGQMMVRSGFSPLNLKHLVDNSPLIVEGEVEAHLGSRLYRRIMETDFQIAVTRVLKTPDSKVPLEKVVIAQLGGKLGSTEIINSQDPLMELGEKCFLFLKAEDRNDIPDFGIPRYVVRGVYYGRFRIDDGKVKLGASQPFAKEMEGKSSDDFRNAVVNLITQ